MSRIISFRCPKCGGMYVKDGKCETCGFVAFEQKTRQSAPESQTPNPGNKASNLMCCPDCGRMISKDAVSCPQCGCPFPGNMKTIQPQASSAQRKSGISVLGVIVAIVVAGLILWYIAAPFSTPVWLQKIGGTIKCFFTGETSYKIFDPSGLAH